ncbi:MULTISPECIES: hypothetical protein [Acidobacteriaceae]|uniref:hypothetical protein n=1 Tax=Acidobacteriaceae TaxID=204434 RepID=UPI00131CD159|nr:MULTISPECIES: hypothetical protein [Acidobacteriaceae]MDW5266952.1 hypothetical protein [Edaphobacter sp.]
MEDEFKVVEVTRLSDTILVTFADGKVAVLENAKVRSLAVDPEKIISLSNED